MNQKNQQIPTHRILTRKIPTEMSSIHLVEVPIHKTAPSTTIQSRQIRARAQNRRPPARTPPSPTHKHRQDPAADQIRDLMHSQQSHTPVYSEKTREKPPSNAIDRQATLQHNNLPVTKVIVTHPRKNSHGQHDYLPPSQTIMRGHPQLLIEKLSRGEPPVPAEHYYAPAP